MKILYVENHKTFADVVSKSFMSEYSVTVVPTICEAQKLLDHNDFDVILVDYDLDDGKGDSLVYYLRERDYKGKIIATSSHDSGNLLLKKAGADIVCGKMEFSKITTVLEEILPNIG